MIPPFRWRLADESESFGNCPGHVRKGIIFARIYSTGQGYNTPTNDLVLNLKIKPPVAANRLRYKLGAIEQFAQEAAHLLNTHNRDRKFILVPMPPSKLRGTPQFDDRLERVATRINQLAPHAGWMPVLDRVQDTGAAHDGGIRNAQVAYASLSVAQRPAPEVLRDHSFLILDDVITSGAQFEGARLRLEESFPGKCSGGLIWARAKTDIAAAFA